MWEGESPTLASPGSLELALEGRESLDKVKRGLETSDSRQTLKAPGTLTQRKSLS